ncbi:MAG: 2-dehydropantoate 2-reductase [Chloroflexota bacterium]
MKNILIVGSGAMATLFAWRLAAAGNSVSLLGGWTEAIRTINRDGVGLVMPNGNKVSHEVRAFSDPLECPTVDLILVLVKAWQTSHVAKQLAQIPSLHGTVITLQNGLGNREILAASLGFERVALGVTTLGATLLGPGWVCLGGEGLTSLEFRSGMESVSEQLSMADFKVELVADATALIWSKLVVSSAINPLTALLKVPNGALLERSSARVLLRVLANETAMVGKKLGVVFPFIDPAAFVESVARDTAKNLSSMLQDVNRGAPTEIDSICGSIVREANLLQVPVPMNLAMWQLLSALG